MMLYVSADLFLGLPSFWDGDFSFVGITNVQLVVACVRVFIAPYTDKNFPHPGFAAFLAEFLRLGCLGLIHLLAIFVLMFFALMSSIMLLSISS